MSQELLAAIAVLAGVLLMLASSAAGQSRSPGWQSVVADRTRDGTAYAMLSPSVKGPAPTLLLLATTGQSTLATEPYRRVGGLLHARDWNVVSLDLPCHGAQRRKGEPPQLAGWATRTARGDDIAADLCARVNKVLDHLVKSRVADPDRIAAAGTSRGGFMAFQAAAANPRIRAVAGFAPVTDLLALTEFANLKSNTLAQQLALVNVAGKLSDRSAWITIGDQDRRVGTDRAAAFAKALTRAAKQKKLRPHVELRVLPVPGHTSPPEWYDQAAAWLLSVVTPAAAQQGKTPPKAQSAPSKVPDEPSPGRLPAVKGFPRMRIGQHTVRPLFTCQEKWEAGIISFFSVVRHKQDWHMWYETFDTEPGHDLKRLLCYARSQDGVRWERPNLGLAEYDGNKSNNIVRDGRRSAEVEFAGTQVFLDGQAPAKERFKMVFIRSGPGSYPLHGATSPDGLKWQEIPTPLIKGNFDTQNICFHDGDAYRLYVRLWTAGVRTVGYTESSTFGKFPAGHNEILAPDNQDPKGMHFYNNAATKLAKDLYVMFPSAFYTKEKDGPVRPHMALSRNGKDFQRVGRDPVLRMGRGSFDSTTIYVAPGVPGDRPGTYWFYYVGYKTGHHVNYEPKAGGIGRFLLLVDEESK
jgi:dienelactone hydrolase